MREIHESTPCPQCGDQADFKCDRRSGSHQTTCRRCGYRECEDLKFDADGNYRGSRRDACKGFGALSYRYANGDVLFRHLLTTAGEVLDAERWLRRALRSGAVDAETAYMTRWFDEINRIEVLVGEPIILLAGKIETTVEFPVDDGAVD